MATTANQGLTKPTVGGDSDAWGGELNTDLDIVDAALSGIGSSFIGGLTLSTAGSSATFSVAAGTAGDGATGTLMTLAASLAKTTSSWTVGATNGALDTGTIANSTWYHVYLIKRVDTGVVDVLVSLSASSPALPTNYTISRRIGSMKTDSSAHWQAFTQYGDEFLWLAPISNNNGSISGVTTALTIGVTTPEDIKTYALVSLSTLGSASNGGTCWASSFDQTDAAVALSGPYSIIVGALERGTLNLAIRTNTSSQFRLRFQAADATYYVLTNGWIDRRGKN